MNIADDDDDRDLWVALNIQFKKTSLNRTLLLHFIHKSYLVSDLIFVINLLHQYQIRCHKVAKFSQKDAIPKTLLQLCGTRQCLINTSFYPATDKTTINSCQWNRDNDQM